MPFCYAFVWTTPDKKVCIRPLFTDFIWSSHGALGVLCRRSLRWFIWSDCAFFSGVHSLQFASISLGIMVSRTHHLHYHKHHHFLSHISFSSLLLCIILYHLSTQVVSLSFICIRRIGIIAYCSNGCSFNTRGARIVRTLPVEHRGDARTPMVPGAISHYWRITVDVSLLARVISSKARSGERGFDPWY